MGTQPMSSAPFLINIKNNQTGFSKERDLEGNVSGVGHFFLDLAITAVEGKLYIPLSISSGKKPTGFVYQIEGTGESSIVSTDISLKEAKESGVTQILLGTIAYVEIPQGKTALLRMEIYIKGQVGREYTIKIIRIEYKRDPSDARYQKYTEEIQTDILKIH